MLTITISNTVGEMLVPTHAAPTTLDRLRVLHAVVAHGTIAAAARRLGYTPSAVSQQLAALERDAGVALVERSNRGVTPTPAGAILADRAADVLDVAVAAFDAARAAAGGEVAVVTIAAFPTAIEHLLLPARAALAGAVDMHIVEAESEVAATAVHDRRVDAAIIDGASGAGLGPGFHRVLLRREPIRLLTHRDLVRDALADYADADWVLADPAGRLGRSARDACHGAGFDPRVICETDDHTTTFAVVAATGAVSMLPALALVELPAGLVVVDTVTIPFTRRIEFVTRTRLVDHAPIASLAAQLGRG